MPNCVETAALPSAPTVVDLFCGAGGFSLGASWAGFHVTRGIDIDHDLTSSFGRNFPNTTLVSADLRRKEVVAALDTGIDTPIAGIIGGPPCQGISEIGKRDVGDIRNGLVVRFFDCVAMCTPRFFVMENVPRLASEAYSELLEAGLNRLPSHYEVLPIMLLNAQHFGAATSRVRLIVLGYDPRSVDAIQPSDLASMRCPAAVTVRDAIEDLPEPRYVAEKSALPYREVEQLSSYALSLRRAPDNNLGNTESRKLCQEALVTGNSLTRHSARVVARFSQVLPGGQDRISRYRRLIWDDPAPVLRAGTGRDRGSYQAARPIHPESDRVITVREAARIQGFPDWFEFSDTKWHSHRMIGNSISPTFACKLLSTIRRKLD